jgi:hypothetical protein
VRSTPDRSALGACVAPEQAAGTAHQRQAERGRRPDIAYLLIDENGYVSGEGGALLVLEDGEIAGYGSLTGGGGANVEHGITPNRPGGSRGALYCTTPSSGFTVSAGQQDRLTVLGVKGSQVQILSSRRRDGRFPHHEGAAHQRFYLHKQAIFRSCLSVLLILRSRLAGTDSCPTGAKLEHGVGRVEMGSRSAPVRRCGFGHFGAGSGQYSAEGSSAPRPLPR